MPSIRLYPPRYRLLQLGQLWSVYANVAQSAGLIPYQYIEVNPYHKPQSLLPLDLRGLVPTLQYDGKPLYESAVICEFLEETYPEYGLKLLPADPYTRARMRIWIDFVSILPDSFAKL